ncbi:aminotransferase class IV family protein [Parasedimentitalea maritima]|uniref:Probable branched-chain-amino-acid aminotransferase n=1 Tax=Parasedimentitalea maritima TaxID=2578117 RepID=A0A6A4RHD5_9RHOB|nr:aminotransferase class IV family protein [Zongyanglinia marina]KAE9630521.1 4-amino-4-deoxychorismate lyase [Zongyanglinia marina]
MEDQICPTSDQDFRLIETFGFVPGQRVARASLHVQRLQASAAALGFEIDLDAVLQRLNGLSANVPLRCRLTLGRAGDLDLETAPMPAPMDLMRFVIAQERLDSETALLRHKTTLRDQFNRARAALPKGLDEAVFLNERDEVCEGTITNVLIVTPDGDHLTPPLSSGCLPGVYRQNQLELGLLREAVLTLSDLKGARRIELVNALRGATQAIWAPECSHFAQFA